jgi:hypothetical protein
MALFGRGSLFELAGAQGAVAMLQAMPIDVKPVLRGALMFNELGGGMRLDGNTVRFMVGVRTAWANPDAVVQKLLAASLDQVMADKTGEIGRSITSAAPGAPFGEDLKAGVGGVAAFVAPIGVIAGVAIPAAMDYMKRAKKSEAELQLNRLGKLATRHFAQAQAFPIGKTWLTPAAPCCEALDHHCPVDPKAWDAQPVWRALDFDVSSPSLYQYSYESDGKTFTARAVGDLDCDGVPATWELKGTSEAGEAHVALTRPPSGVE